VGIVFCGKQTIDGDTAQVGPGIASRLGFSQLTLVDRIESLDLIRRRIRVRRKLEGRHEIVEAPLPVMITVVRELNRPRYPVVAMRLEAEDKEVKVWDNSALKLDVETIGLKGSRPGSARYSRRSGTRGRSSATALLIRMTLPDSFSINCSLRIYLQFDLTAIRGCLQ